MDSESQSQWVTYRELLSTFDARDTRIFARIDEVERKIDQLDDRGSRGLQRVADRLDVAVKELEEHALSHKELARRGISLSQWSVTTFLALCGTVFAGIALWHGG